MLELDLDEEGAVQFAQLLGLAIFYSRKSYNPQVLISECVGRSEASLGGETGRLYLHD
jgi:hypothetical protein